jgi:hypothetical protein
MDTNEARDIQLRAAIYDEVMSSGSVPTIAAMGTRLGWQRDEVTGSLERLAAARALVLQPGTREVLMANPFSAVPTPFAVSSGGVSYYGNCIWDALGIPAMLHRDAEISTSCACCGDAMQVRVTAGQLVPLDGVIHFAIAARKWWQDIVFN